MPLLLRPPIHLYLSIAMYVRFSNAVVVFKCHILHLQTSCRIIPDFAPPNYPVWHPPSGWVCCHMPSHMSNHMQVYSTIHLVSWAQPLVYTHAWSDCECPPLATNPRLTRPVPPKIYCDDIIHNYGAKNWIFTLLVALQTKQNFHIVEKIDFLLKIG